MTRYAMPTPANQREVPGKGAVAALCAALALVMVLALWAGLSGYIPEYTEASQRPEPAVTHDSLTVTHTHDGGEIRWYVATDPDYGWQYLVTDNGACTPRVGPDGTQARAEGWGGE